MTFFEQSFGLDLVSRSTLLIERLDLTKESHGQALHRPRVHRFCVCGTCGGGCGLRQGHLLLGRVAWHAILREMSHWYGVSGLHQVYARPIPQVVHAEADTADTRKEMRAW